MSNITLLRGNCPAPFLDISKFPTDGGFIDGRLCSPIPGVANLICCMPCPLVDFIYPESFQTWNTATGAVSAVGLALMVFLLLSWMILPVEKTRRHYLSVCLGISVMMISLGFVIPLAAHPEQCYNEITPNDMYSNLTCAWSGAFVIAGGVATTIWIFIRALSMHLQICWDVQPGRKFFYCATAMGWGVAGLLFTITITITGVSFRFGDACHVNSKHALEDFWGPLLGISGAAALVQLLTFGYCIKVYLANMWSDEKTETNTSTGLQSMTTSLRVHSAKAVYRRVRKVIWLQWRGMLIIVFILVDVIFLAVVFVFLDASEDPQDPATLEKFEPFLLCLIAAGGRSAKCDKMAQNITVSESIAVTVLMLLSLGGIETFLTLSRWTMFTGWLDLVRNRLTHKNEFVSLDARQTTPNVTKSYELLKVGSPGQWKSMESSTVTSPASTYAPTFERRTSDYFTSQQSTDYTREYKSPTSSFSTPRPPSAGARPPSAQGRPRTVSNPRSVEWDHRATYARSGNALYSPQEEDEYRNRI